MVALEARRALKVEAGFRCSAGVTTLAGGGCLACAASHEVGSGGCMAGMLLCCGYSGRARALRTLVAVTRAALAALQAPRSCGAL